MKRHPRWSRKGVVDRPYRAIWRPDSGESALPEKPTPQSGLQVFYFCDAHGRIFEECEENDTIPERLSALRNDTTGDSLFLGGGDDHGGGSIWDAFLTVDPIRSPAYRLYAHCGLDAITLGNHDLDWGEEVLIRALEDSGLNVIVTNLPPGSAFAPVSAPANVFEFADKLVGVLGIANISEVLNGGQIFTDPIQAIASWVDFLQSRVHSLIILSHLGSLGQPPSDDPQLLARISSDILVCGSHSHLLIPRVEAGESRGNYLQSGSGFAHFGFARWEESGKWFVRNRPVSELPKADRSTTAGRLLRARRELLAQSGRISFSYPSFKEESPAHRYGKENSWLNWACDRLAELARETFPLEENPRLVGMSARFLGSAPLSGDLDLADWYRMFPYGDRLVSFLFSAELLPALLKLNAQNLLSAPHDLPNKAWLHFDASLRWEVLLTSSSAEIQSIRLGGQALETGFTGKIRLLTHSYVACGSGGYGERFAKLGLTPEDLHIHPLSIRDFLWNRARQTSPWHGDPLDHRLIVR